MSGGVTISGNQNMATLDGALPRLQALTGDLSIYSNHNLVTLGICPRLQTITGRLYVNSNHNLATLGRALSALQTIDGSLHITNNQLLTTIGSSFGGLQSVGELYWHGNGQTSSSTTAAFCASARATLCPTTYDKLPNYR